VCYAPRPCSARSSFLALFIAVAALLTIAPRLGIAYPISLVIGGLLLGLVPHIPRVEVDPDLRGLRANLGIIGSLAIGLIIATAVAAAFVPRALIPGPHGSVALALGAIVALCRRLLRRPAPESGRWSPRAGRSPPEGCESWRRSDRDTGRKIAGRGANAFDISLCHNTGAVIAASVHVR
jgi:hypothetical protein